MDSELSNKEIKNYPLKLSFFAFRDTEQKQGTGSTQQLPTLLGKGEHIALGYLARQEQEIKAIYFKNDHTHFQP